MKDILKFLLICFTFFFKVRQVMIQNSYASSDITVEETKMFKPVAFQIRYRGCKGMVVEYPIGGRKIRIRPSMNKFECTTSKYLEIVKTSAPSLFVFIFFY